VLTNSEVYVHNCADSKLCGKYYKQAIIFSLFFFGLLLFHSACVLEKSQDKEIPAHLLNKFPAKSFAYPVGEQDYVTEKNDWRDAWYNAQDFGENRHLGEDWNKTTGGNTDCGEPVYAAADGQITFAKDAGAGWEMSLSSNTPPLTKQKFNVFTDIWKQY